MATLWKGHRLLDSVLQMAHLIFALAATVGPFIIQPFLAPTCNQTISNITGNESYFENINERYDVECDETRVHFVFVIASSLFILPAVGLFSVYAADKFSPTEQLTKPMVVINEKSKEVHEHKNKTNKNVCRIVMIMLISFYGLLYQWIESSFSGFLYTFVSKGLGWEKSYGARAMSLFWGGVCTGRLTGVFLSARLRARTLLLFYMIGVTSALILLAFVESHQVILWIGTAWLGFTVSPAFAAILAWTVKKTKFDGFVSGMFMLGVGVGSMSGPAVTGYLFQEHGHMWLIYSLLIICPVAFLVFTGIELLTTFNKRNFVQNQVLVDHDIPADSRLLKTNDNGN